MAEVPEGPKEWHLKDRLNPFEEGISNKERHKRLNQFGVWEIMSHKAAYIPLKHGGKYYVANRAGKMWEMEPYMVKGRNIYEEERIGGYRADLTGTGRYYGWGGKNWIWNFDEAVDYAPGMKGGGYVPIDRAGMGPKPRPNYKYERGRKQRLIDAYGKYQKVEEARRKEERKQQLEEQRRLLSLEEGRVRAKGLLASRREQQALLALTRSEMDTPNVTADPQPRQVAKKISSRRRKQSKTLYQSSSLRRPI
tara:strand:- start:3498 stop:4250 length:753 start_codon:yes stop_codon:yes gene_type:complete